MKRRAFLLSAGAAATLCRLGRASPAFFGGIENLDALATFGEIYLAALLPVQRASVAKAANLFIRAAGPLSPAAFRTQLSACIAADFAGGAIIMIDGWLLAETEARLCAAVYLHGWA